ncbi:MAG TPA: hypothetical protein V6D17_01560 [Candidatus Obscuribacterales bacterium]
MVEPLERPLHALESEPEKKLEEEPSSLWRTAYEHPVETGIALAGAAAATAAVVFSRGKLARLLPHREVLVVEAAPYMGKAMKKALQDQGHTVTWVTEINRLRPLTALTDEGKEIGLNLRRFHTAFLDPNHVHKAVPEFADLVPVFRHNNVRTIGTSVMDNVNQKMLAAGVDAAGNKPIVLASIVGNKLNLREAIRNPGSAQKVFDWLKPRFNDPELKTIKQRTNDLLTQSM